MLRGAGVTSQRVRLPFLPRLFLRWLLPLRDREFIIGDLDEEFSQKCIAFGRARAVLWYWRQAAASLFSEARYSLDDAPTAAFGEPARGSSWSALSQDLRYALRSLNRRPVFTTVAAITLALGIGANTAIFSIANWLLFRPIPGVAQPQELLALRFGAPQTEVGISWLNLNDLRRMTSSFAGLTGYAQIRLQLKSGSEPARTIQAAAVEGNYFTLLGAGIQRGRAIQEQEGRPGSGSTAVVISDRLWLELFQRDPAVIGRTLRANKITLTVVGVAERGFHGVERFGSIDVWVPFALYAQLRHLPDQAFYQRGTGIRFFSVITRLEPGISQPMAQADLSRAMAALVTQNPADNAVYKKALPTAEQSIDLSTSMRARIESAVTLMLIAVALLLAISSANVANMLLVRGLQKRPEAAIRRALGASARRLTVQTLIESLLLALLGCVGGLLILRVILALFAGSRIINYFPSMDHVPVDARVLAFALGTSVLTGLLFGLAPVSVVRRVNVNAELQARSARITGAASLARRGIATAQVALSLALLVGTLVVTRTLRRLTEVDSGYDHERLAGFLIATEPQGYTAESEMVLGDRLLQHLRGSPGVEAAALARAIPLEPVTAGFAVNDPLQRSEQRIDLQMQMVSDDYFRTLGLPILAGRAINQEDWTNAAASEFNIVLSASAARKIFAGRNVLGQTLTTTGRKPKALRVVGVAADASLNILRDPVREVAYLPFPAMPFPGFVVLLRSHGAPAALESDARVALSSVEPAIPLDFHVVSENIREQASTERFLSRLFGLLSVLAVLLAGIGLYGVLTAIVAERRREIGIRMALGARAVRVLLLVSRESASLVGVGVLFGLLGAYALCRSLSHVLTDAAPLDPWTYLLATLMFAVVAALATALPTLTATRLTPASVLKQD